MWLRMCARGNIEAVGHSHKSVRTALPRGRDALVKALDG